jgi:hypothetical protein
MISALAAVTRRDACALKENGGFIDGGVRNRERIVNGRELVAFTQLNATKRY